MNVSIPYRPRYPQTEIHPQLESHRFCVLVTHRQMGKTVCAINHMIKMALINPKPAPRYFYVAPFLKQAKLIAWDYLRKYTRNLPNVKVNEVETSVTLPNGAKVWVAGADNEDALRGTYADGVKIIDGVRYSKDDSIETDGAAKITHRKGDFLLESGKTYTAVKNGSLLPGSYTVLASSDSAVSFKLRIGGYVRNYSHGDTIVLADGDQICAVSCNVILR